MSTSQPLGVASLDVPSAAARVPRARTRHTTLAASTAMTAPLVRYHTPPLSSMTTRDARAGAATCRDVHAVTADACRATAAAATTTLPPHSAAANTLPCTNASSRSTTTTAATVLQWMTTMTPLSVPASSSDMSLPSPPPRPVQHSALTARAMTATAARTLATGLIASTLATERVTTTTTPHSSCEGGRDDNNNNNDDAAAAAARPRVLSSERVSLRTSYAGTSPLLLPVSPVSGDNDDGASSHANDLVCRVLSTATTAPTTTTTTTTPSSSSSLQPSPTASAMARAALSWLRYLLEHRREQLRRLCDATAHACTSDKDDSGGDGDTHSSCRHAHAAVTRLLRDVYALQQSCSNSSSALVVTTSGSTTRGDVQQQQQQQQQRQLCVRVSNELAALVAAEDGVCAHTNSSAVAAAAVSTCAGDSNNGVVGALTCDAAAAAARVTEMCARYEAMVAYSNRLQRRLYTLQAQQRRQAATAAAAATPVTTRAATAAHDKASDDDDARSSSSSTTTSSSLSSAPQPTRTDAAHTTHITTTATTVTPPPRCAAVASPSMAACVVDSDADVLRGALARYAATTQQLREELTRSRDEAARLRATVATLRESLAQHRTLLEELQTHSSRSRS